VLVVRIGSLGVILATIISYLVVLVAPQSFEVLKVVRNIERERPFANPPQTGSDVEPIL
jgi:hypothetical protein